MRKSVSRAKTSYFTQVQPLPSILQRKRSHIRFNIFLSISLIRKRLDFIENTRDYTIKLKKCGQTIVFYNMHSKSYDGIVSFITYTRVYVHSRNEESFTVGTDSSQISVRNLRYNRFSVS